MTTISSAHPFAASTTGTNPSSGSSSGNTQIGNATITSTDFLTLLVTQLKNQDPTQPTDPTQYVSQLVGVNSLEQLIDINQQLTSISKTATATDTSN